MKRKSMSGIGKGVDALLHQDDKTEKQHEAKTVNQQDDTQSNQQDDLERATFYIRPDQNITLEELRIKLRKLNIKSNKSEIVRKAIDLLAEQHTDLLVSKFTGK